ncbi:shikimate dehydrogenase [Clostridium sp. MSJ-11]|uniref:Shikimate dehydrogenase n=1 Tax=Clostridium mobile TaxID=2841512 RepID=A0ABS6EID1_9CLOT|nr:shikimate dehydrogenase [Clostridium mobile]MBU5484956.1 shikimate dehydrogenase [Clostridium mobile]
MKYTGLLGKNIGYSQSPQIHNNYYRINNIDFYYKIFDIDEKDISDFIDNLKENDILGFNITIPYKRVILNYLKKVKYPADKIGAVNTVVLTEEGLVGYNTDYYGFLESLKINEINLYDKKALIIGNGGAAKCVYEALVTLTLGSIDMVSRSIIKDKDEFKNINKFLILGEENDYSPYHIIINCTPVGGENYKDISPINLGEINENLIIYDLNYSPSKTKLLKEGELLGAKIINGELMLKLQAYKAIEIWKQHRLERR